MKSNLRLIGIVPKSAPAPVGPYSPAVAFNNLLFTSGQIAIIPGEDQLETGDIEKETLQVLENLSSLLLAGGASIDSVIKCTIYVTDINHYQIINDVYSRYFSHTPAPARELVEVKALPKNANIEISAVAALK